MRSNRGTEKATAEQTEAAAELQSEEITSRSQRLQQNKKREKSKSARRKHVIAVIISIVAVAVGIYLLLLLVSKLALYDSISAMLQDMYASLQVILPRLTS